MKIKNDQLNKLIPIAEELQHMEIDLYANPVKAGLPSEVYNRVEDEIDFNKLLIKNKESTFVYMLVATT